jgi:hypothetical protein
VTSPLVIITPELKRGCGGLADHTLRLLECWGCPQHVSVLIPHDQLNATAESVSSTTPLGLTAEEIQAQLPLVNGRVLVQYSAYGFDRLGYPRELIKALIDWKTTTGGRLVVMFHEIWTFWPLLNKNYFLQRLHRRRIRRLLAACDGVFTSTPSQAGHLRDLAPGAAVQVLPVGTNIRPVDSPPANCQPGSALLFGLQPTRVRALKTMHQHLLTLARAGVLSRIVCIGQGDDPSLAAAERELLQGLGLAKGFEQQGSMPEHAVSQALFSAEFAIFGQNELSCHKSGSFMAYAAHQSSVIADFAAPAKPPPICWLVAPGELLGGIDKSEVRRRAKFLRIWQEQHASWATIADALGGALGLNGIPPG